MPTVGSQIVLGWSLPVLLANPTVGSEVARMMMDPHHVAYVSGPNPGGLIEYGGGYTQTSGRTGTSSVCQADATDFHNKYGTSRPPLNTTTSNRLTAPADETGSGRG